MSGNDKFKTWHEFFDNLMFEESEKFMKIMDMEPQQAEREPLTDEQAAKLITEATGWQSPLSAHYCIVRIIERTLATRWGVKLKESN